jgi:hypothetical protein
VLSLVWKSNEIDLKGLELQGSAELVMVTLAEVSRQRPWTAGVAGVWLATHPAAAPAAARPRARGNRQRPLPPVGCARRLPAPVVRGSNCRQPDYRCRKACAAYQVLVGKVYRDHDFALARTPIDCTNYPTVLGTKACCG